MIYYYNIRFTYIIQQVYRIDVNLMISNVCPSCPCMCYPKLYSYSNAQQL